MIITVNEQQVLKESLDNISAISKKMEQTGECEISHDQILSTRKKITHSQL